MNTKTILNVFKTLILIYVVFILITFFNSSSKLKQYNIKLEQDIIRVEKQNKSILKKIKIDSVKMANNKMIIEKLELKDSITTIKIKETTKKYNAFRLAYFKKPQTYKDSLFTAITESTPDTRQDSAVSKILVGNNAIKVSQFLNTRIKNKDEIINKCKESNQIALENIAETQEALKNKDGIIDNQEELIKNEVKLGRKKGFNGFLKGTAIGAGIIFIINSIIK